MKRPFIIDCDTGTDDAIALMAAFSRDQIELKGITSVNGNVGEELTSRNNLALTEYLGIDVPVMRGAKRPMGAGFVYHAEDAHGRTGLGSVVIPDPAKTHFESRIASEFIHDTAVELGGELEILAIGPMTNLALTFVNYPETTGLIKHLWFMGGAILGGNSVTSAEFNIWADPDAAALVFNSGIPMTMVGLDVTDRAIMKPEQEAMLRASGGKAATLAADILEFMFGRKSKGMEDAAMHDALALASAVYPECLTFEDHFVDVEVRGSYTRGHTMVDLRHRTGQAPNMQVAVDVDVEKFRAWLVDAVKATDSL